MRRINLLITLFLVLLFSVGCAAIIHGTKQDISVNSNPSGVNVYVMGVHKATTPAIIEVRRKDSIIILKFEKEGYEPVEIALSRSVDGWIWGEYCIRSINWVSR